MVKNVKVLMAFLISLAFYLPYNGFIPITDPVEANYALTAKEMVLSGNWLSPQIYGQYWFDKPIMIYWLIAGCFKVFGFGEFAARLPAALFSAASVAFAYWFAGKLYGNRKTALLSALVIGTALEFWILSRMIITDAVLMFFNSVALGTFYLGLMNHGKLWYGVAYAASAFAVLTKGPVGIALPAMIVFAFIMGTRRWQLLKRLFIFPGVLVFLVVAVPWYYAMYRVHGQVFVDTFLGLHNYLRATVSEHPKDNVFYYYLVLFPISLLPWTGVFFRMLLRSAREFRGRHFTYLAFWIGTTLLFYSLMATKYPTYVFPALFPAALLISNFITSMKAMPGRNIWLWLSIPTMMLIFIFMALPKFLPDFSCPYILVGLGGTLFLAVLWLQIKGNPRRLPEMAVIVVILMGLIIVRNGLIPFANVRAAKVITAQLPIENKLQIGSYGEYATSAVFYSGYRIPKLVTELDQKATGVWAGKYTMPVETIQDFLEQSDFAISTYLLVKMSNQQLFLQEPWAKQFIPVAVYKDTTLYKRIQ